MSRQKGAVYYLRMSIFSTQRSGKSRVSCVVSNCFRLLRICSRSRRKSAVYYLYMSIFNAEIGQIRGELKQLRYQSFSITLSNFSIS